MHQNTIVFFLLVAGLFHSCNSINATYSKLSAENKERVIIPKTFILFEYQEKLKTNTSEIFVLNGKVLNEIIANSPKDFILLMEYATWCKPCIDKFDSNILEIEKHKNIELILYTSDDYLYCKKSQSFLENKMVNFPSFMLDIGKYGGEFSGHKRFSEFFNSELCDDCKEIPDGLPKYILIDRLNKSNFSFQVGELNIDDLINKL